MDTRTLRLRRESLTPLAGAELTGVAAGGIDRSIPCLSERFTCMDCQHTAEYCLTRGCVTWEC